MPAICLRGGNLAIVGMAKRPCGFLGAEREALLCEWLVDGCYIHEFGNIFRYYRSYFTITGPFYYVVDSIDLGDSVDHDHLRNELAPHGCVLADSFHP